MLQTYYLRFPDEISAKEILQKANLYFPQTDQNPTEYFKQADIGWAFDPIGTITIPGTYDPETQQQLTPPVPVPGWHANYIGEELPEDLKPYNVDPAPKTPYRVFA